MAARKKPKKGKKKKVTRRKKKTSKKLTLDPSIQEIVEREVIVNCPVRGLIVQKVKVKILKPVSADTKQVIETKDYIDKIEDDETPIYGGTDSLDD